MVNDILEAYEEMRESIGSKHSGNVKNFKINFMKQEKTGQYGDNSGTVYATKFSRGGETIAIMITYDYLGGSGMTEIVKGEDRIFGKYSNMKANQIAKEYMDVMKATM